MPKNKFIYKIFIQLNILLLLLNKIIYMLLIKINIR